MKLNGIVGKGSGKLGASVFAISGGEQIVRQYNPQVANPNTDAQIEQRAKLKLMSQLAAALAPAIAFKKEGLVSARNKFVSANIGNCTFENNKAKVSILGLDLTGSHKPLPAVFVQAGQNETASVELSGAASADIDAVLYCAVSYDDGEPFRLIDIKISETPGTGRTFNDTVKADGDKTVVLAYGIVEGAGKNGASFGNYFGTQSDVLANVEAISKIVASASTFTQTQAGNIA